MCNLLQKLTLAVTIAICWQPLANGLDPDQAHQNDVPDLYLKLFWHSE